MRKPLWRTYRIALEVVSRCENHSGAPLGFLRIAFLDTKNTLGFLRIAFLNAKNTLGFLPPVARRASRAASEAFGRPKRSKRTAFGGKPSAVDIGAIETCRSSGVALDVHTGYQNPFGTCVE